uniref:Uncharacterized protein n=1 Tax=Cacopsylla melanoneura TaxID=428564 RepID=A0A8D8QNZ0_9HEMI
MYNSTFTCQVSSRYCTYLGTWTLKSSRSNKRSDFQPPDVSYPHLFSISRISLIRALEPVFFLKLEKYSFEIYLFFSVFIIIFLVFVPRSFYVKFDVGKTFVSKVCVFFLSWL